MAVTITTTRELTEQIEKLNEAHREFRDAHEKLREFILSPVLFDEPQIQRNCVLHPFLQSLPYILHLSEHF